MPLSVPVHLALLPFPSLFSFRQIASHLSTGARARRTVLMSEFDDKLSSLNKLFGWLGYNVHVL